MEPRKPSPVEILRTAPRRIPEIYFSLSCSPAASVHSSGPSRFNSITDSLFEDTMKSRLLLHICCAPDEAFVIQSLQAAFELSCWFCNPNIQPENEYRKRLEEASRVAACYAVPFNAEPYNPESWHGATAGYHHTPEGGERCFHCFLLRFRSTAHYCKKIEWPAFTSVMSISPHKRIEMLDKAGTIAAREYNVEYKPFNFKKNDGFKKSIILSNELGLYRQDYCGCILSRKERDNRKSRIT
ncbi:MAG: hypothetical protein GF350_17440 [Chitinivibrionales bacterium]|nr:hypothetical protein [Chitinivibrionales bacterium]